MTHALFVVCRVNANYLYIGIHLVGIFIKRFLFDLIVELSIATNFSRHELNLIELIWI